MHISREENEKKIFYGLIDNCQSFVTGNSQHSLKQNLGLLTSALGLQNNLVLIRSMLNDLFIAAVEARGKTVYYSDTELLPFVLPSAGAYPHTQVHTRLLHVQETSRQRTLGSHGVLYGVLGWCPEELGHRA